MAARDTLRAHAVPLLDEDEFLVTVFPASSGMHPLIPLVLILGGLAMNIWSLGMWALIPLGLGLAAAAWIRNLVIAITNQAVVVMESGFFMAYRARHVVDRLPEQTPVGPLSGFIWMKAAGLSEGFGKDVYVHRGFRRDAVGGSDEGTVET